MDFPAYVPGYAVDGPLGTNGTVWAGREEVTGAVVALRLLPLADPSARERARREVAMLTAVDHPHVLPLLGVVDVSGALVLVLELAEGGSLDDLLVARGTLSPGEVVTACAPIAQALAELHDHGIVHGQVAADSVLFSADGKPMLANLGTAVPRRNGPSRVVPPELQAGFPAQPGTDVYGLAAVAVRSLTGYAPNQALMLPGVPPATQSALAQAMHSDPDRRPAASFLANALFVLADPEPVVLAPNAAPSVPLQPDPAAAEEATELPVETSPAPRSRRAARRAQAAESAAPTRLAAAPAPTSTIEAPPISREIEPEPRRRRRRRLRRVDLARFAMVVAIPVILAGAVFAALQLWGGGDGDTEALPGATRVTSPGAAEVPVDLCGGPQPAPSEQPPEVGDWTQVVQSLYLMRAEAFNEVDAQALCDVYAPTSQALADDAELLQLYADAGVHTRGLAFEVITAELVSQEAGRVVLEITDRLPPYELVNSSGAVKAEKEGLPEATWQAVLVPSPDASGWRFG
jgi:hypothetical protein